MATKVQTILISDISGDEIADGGGQTIEFAYRGVQYTIDLSNQEAGKFDKVMDFYTAHGTRRGGRAARGSGKSSSSSDLRVMREWLRANGHPVNDRGRVSQELQDIYKAAQ